MNAIANIGTEVQPMTQGFTPLPNFIVDERYLTVLSGEAVKCLIVLNRHIAGHHFEERALGAGFFKDLTGVQDVRTIRKAINELVEYQLITSQKELGKSRIYTLTFNNRKVVVEVERTKKPRTPKAPSTPNVATSDDTRPLTQDDTSPITYDVATSNDTSSISCTTTSDISCTSTSSMGCTSDKEILKENIKENNNSSNTVLENTQGQKPIQFVTYHVENQKNYNLIELVSEYPNCSLDFIQVAKDRFQDLSELDFENLMQGFGDYFSGKPQNKNTPSLWMTKWLTWVKRNKHDLNQRRVAEKPQAPTKHNPRNVNDAWGEPKKYAPVMEDDA